MVAALAIGAAFLGYLFTKNPQLLMLTKNLAKLTLLFAAIIAIIYLLERVLVA
jgi:TRAP-type uncharacterized transport system fused permease subunit